MGIDADVLLRVRDRAALREAMDARAARERARWAEQGREAEFGALPFFRESLVGELRDAADLPAVVERLGERGKLVPLRTFDEAFRAERANVKAWLREG